MSENHQSPFPGLRPFEDRESAIFFGRGEQIADMLAELEVHRFLAVVGASGSGKSSLVRAGLLPALREGFLADSGSDWLIVIAQPGASPFQNLARAFFQAVHREEPNPNQLSLEEAQMRRSRNAFSEAVQAARLPEGTSVLLLVDQFEEIFRFRRQTAVRYSKMSAEDRASLTKEDCDKLKKEEELYHQSRSEAAAFVNLMLKSAECESPRIYVVLTMRSDFVGYCDSFHGLPEAMNKAQFLTPRLRRDQAEEAICGPLELFGAQASAELSNEILNKIGSDPDQLPLMQHLLSWMWEQERLSAAEEAESEGRSFEVRMVSRRRRRAGGGGGNDSHLTLTLEDYHEIGGLRGALDTHADLAFDELGNTEDGTKKQIAETMFRALCDRGYDGQLTRRNPPPSIGEIAQVAGATWQEVDEVAEHFLREGRSFIYASPKGAARTEDTKLDVSHEALIRQWGKMQEWARKEADSAETYLEVVKDARRWDDKEGDLWTKHELRRGLRWQQEQVPTQAWADRYDSDLPLAEKFLKKGKLRRDVRRGFALGVACIALLALIVGALIERQRIRDEKELEIAAERVQVQSEKARVLQKQWTIADREFELAKTLAQTGKLREAVLHYWRVFDVMEVIAQDDLMPPHRKKDAREYQESALQLISAWSAEIGIPLLHDGPVLAMELTRGGTGLVTLSDRQDGAKSNRVFSFWDLPDSAAGRPQPALRATHRLASELAGSIPGMRSWTVTPNGGVMYVGEPSGKDASLRVHRIKSTSEAGSTADVDLLRIPGQLDFPSQFGWSENGECLLALTRNDVLAWRFEGKDLRRPEDRMNQAPVRLVANPVKFESGTRAPAKTATRRLAISRDGSLLAIANVLEVSSTEPNVSRPMPNPVPAVVVHDMPKAFLERAKSQPANAGRGPWDRPAVYVPAYLKALRLSFDPAAKQLAIAWELPPPSDNSTQSKSTRMVAGVELCHLEGARITMAGSYSVPWTLKAGREAQRPEDLWAQVRLLFSPDGSALAFFAPDAPVYLLQIADARDLPYSVSPYFGVDQRVLLPLKSRFGLDHSKELTSVTFNHKGTSLLVGSKDWKASLWSIAPEPGSDRPSVTQLGQPLVHSDEVTNCAFTPDGKWILTASKDRTVRLRPATIGQPDRNFPILYQGKPVPVGNENDRFLCLAADGKTILVTGLGVEEGKGSPSEPLLRFADGKWNGGMIIRLPSTEEEQPVFRPLQSTNTVELKSRQRLRIPYFPTSPPPRPKNPLPSDPLLFATGELSDMGAPTLALQLWNGSEGEELGSLEIPASNFVLPIALVAVSGDGTHLLLSAPNGKVVLWERESKRVLGTLDVPTGGQSKLISSVNTAGGPIGWAWIRFDPANRNRFVTGGPDEWVRVWKYEPDAFSREEPRMFTLQGKIRSNDSKEPRPIVAEFSPDGRHVLTTSSDNGISIWDAASGEIVHSNIGGAITKAEFLGYSSDGRTVLISDQRDSLQWLEARTAHPLGSALKTLRSGSVAFHPEAEFVIQQSTFKSASDDGKSFDAAKLDLYNLVGPALGSDPERLRLSVEARTGMRIGREGTDNLNEGGPQEGKVDPLEQEEWWRLMEELSRRGGFCDIPPRE